MEEWLNEVLLVRARTLLLLLGFYYLHHLLHRYHEISIIQEIIFYLMIILGRNGSDEDFLKVGEPCYLTLL